MNELANRPILTLEQEWRKYRDACYPPHKGELDPVQEAETRSAYFAACLTVLKFAVEGAHQLPEDQAMGFIAGLIKEAQTVCAQRVYELRAGN